MFFVSGERVLGTLGTTFERQASLARMFSVGQELVTERVEDLVAKSRANEKLVGSLQQEVVDLTAEGLKARVASGEKIVGCHRVTGDVDLLKGEDGREAGGGRISQHGQLLPLIQTASMSNTNNTTAPPVPTDGPAAHRSPPPSPPPLSNTVATLVVVTRATYPTAAACVHTSGLATALDGAGAVLLTTIGGGEGMGSEGVFMLSGPDELVKATSGAVSRGLAVGNVPSLTRHLPDSQVAEALEGRGGGKGGR